MSLLLQTKRTVSEKFPRLYDALHGLIDLTSDGRRARRRDEAEAYRHLRAQLGGGFDSAAETQTGKTVLFFSLSDIRACVMESPIIAAFQKAGYEPLVFASRGAYLRRAYRLFGLNNFATVDDYQESLADQRVDAAMSNVGSQKALLAVTEGSVRVGKYAASSLLRAVRRGTVDLIDPGDRAICRSALSSSIAAADAAKRIFEKYRPEAVVMTDRGYTPYGEMFDLAVSRGVPVFTFNAAYRSGEIALKRFGAENEDRHFLTLSEKTWSRLRGIPWSEAKWQGLEREFVECYTKGDWFAEVGTQFNAEVKDRAEVLSALSLDPRKKTAILFAHIFWDATFFYGEDLFRDYEEWFCETLRKAAENDRVNWIVKVHPANVVKDQRDGAVGEHGEVTAIRRTLGELPAHMKVLPADTTISTLSLFEVMDYCLTVRGTIGIEAACRGIRVLTAGTGRYDGCGFTADFESRDDFLQSLEHIEDLAKMSEVETELARRYAYGVFKTRSIPLTSVGFGFARNEKAKMETWIQAKSRDEMMCGEDVTVLARWIVSGDDDCCRWQSGEAG